jgi:hypothetical protein
MSSVAASVAEKKQLKGWRDILPLDWVEEGKYSDLIVEGYSSSLRPAQQEVLLAAKGVIKKICEHRLGICFVHFSDSNNLQSGQLLSLYQDGNRLIQFNIEERKIPPGDYVLLFSPALKLSYGTQEGIARNALAVGRGLLMMLAGHTAAEQLVFTFRIPIDAPDKIGFASPATENFLLADQFSFCSVESVRLLSDRILHHLPSEIQRRFETALIFLSRATSEMDATVRFTSFWIALEVVAGGYGQVIRLTERISNSASLRAKLNEIKDARDGLFHYGRRYALSQAQERIICALILGELFLRYEIADPKLAECLSSLSTQQISGMKIDSE